MATSAWLLSRAAQHPSESALAVAIVLVQLFALSRGFLRYGERLIGHDAAFRVLAAQRIRIFRHLERLAPAGLPEFRSGDLLARVVADVDSLQDLILRVIPPFAIALVVGTATVVLVWALLPLAGLVLAATLAVSATVIPWLTGVLARRNESHQAALRGELTASVVDLIEGASELAVYGATGAQLGRISSGDRELTAVARSAAATTGIGLGLTTLLSGLATWGVLLVGVPAVHSGRLGGVWLATLALIPLAAFELVSGLPVATQTLQKARQTAARLFAIAQAPDPVAVAVAGSTLQPPSPPVDLEVRGLRAGYPGAPHPVLHGIDLTLPPGKRIAIVGPSGAGKSTLASVLLGFLPIEGGTVSVGGVPVTRLSGEDLRTLVGMVGQDAHLFDTSLAENLRIGRRTASDAELIEVLERVGLGPWLDGLPDGLGTGVGRFGARVSGGQRQRVAIARALLAEFPILVLDEPAEHLDLDAADALTADLLAVTEGRSTIMITHRLAGLEAVDEILFLTGGRVAERGSHRELLESGAGYAALWWNEANAERGARTLSTMRSSDRKSPTGPPRAPAGEHFSERSNER